MSPVSWPSIWRRSPVPGGADPGIYQPVRPHGPDEGGGECAAPAHPLCTPELHCPGVCWRQLLPVLSGVSLKKILARRVGFHLCGQSVLKAINMPRVKQGAEKLFGTLPARMLLSVQVLYFTYSCGSTTLPSLLTEKCRCGPTSPSAAAVEPTRPMMSPASTVLPCSTGGSCCRLLYCVS